MNTLGMVMNSITQGIPQFFDAYYILPSGLISQISPLDMDR